MPVKDDRTMVWTNRGIGATVLNLMSAHRLAAGRRLVALREARLWSQEDLAHEAGLSVKTVSRFENGRHDGRRSTVEKLAGALDVQEGDIMGAPPAPLALGESSQLDRIEAKLDELLELLRPKRRPGKVLSAAAQRERDRRRDTPEGRKRTPPKAADG